MSSPEQAEGASGAGRWYSHRQRPNYHSVQGRASGIFARVFAFLSEPVASLCCAVLESASAPGNLAYICLICGHVLLPDATLVSEPLPKDQVCRRQVIAALVL